MTGQRVGPTYDVVVIGGGAAGLAGATALGRSRRSVLVVDSGEPRNAPASHVHNYLGREGTPPLELTRLGRAEVEQYGVQMRAGRVVTVERVQDGWFGVALDDGTQVSARRLLLATGVTDRLPAVPGVAERWGRDVLHCPYCHGWEVRDRAIGVLAANAAAAHSALLFRQLSDDVVVFLDGRAPVGDVDLERLRARGVRLVQDAVSGLVVTDDRLTGVRLVGGEVVDRDALVVTTYADARTALVDHLVAGLGLQTQPILMGELDVATGVVADPTGRTGAPGVWAAGNVVAPMAQVIASAAAGLMAGAMINMDLVEEETAAEVNRARQVAATI